MFGLDIQIVALASLLSVASAAVCQNLRLSVPVIVPQVNLTIEYPRSDVDVTNFLLNLSRRGHDYGKEVYHLDLQCLEDANCVGFKEEWFSFDATYCHPNNGSGKAIQILTAGLEWDRMYWDPVYDDFSYSYVACANDVHDFATLAWDGLDQDPKNQLDGFTVTSLLELEALHHLTQMIRGGSIEAIGKYDKIIHVGHGWGSQFVFNLATVYPEDSDGIVLTGFFKTDDATPCPPHSLDPAAFVLDEQPGWIIHNSYSALQSMYFSPEYVDIGMMDVALLTLRPLPMGELLTHSLAGAGINNQYSGPALTVVGQRDVLYCGGDCYGNGLYSPEDLEASMNEHFKNTTSFQLYVVPGGGHVLNFVTVKILSPASFNFSLTMNSIEQYTALLRNNTIKKALWNEMEALPTAV